MFNLRYKKQKDRPMSDSRDNTLWSKLDDLRIAYIGVIRAVQFHHHSFATRFIKPKVELVPYRVDGVFVLSLVCEGYSLSIVFNDTDTPHCILDDFSDKTLLEAFGKNIKGLDNRVSNFYEDLKTLNNHLKQLSNEAMNELFSI